MVQVGQVEELIDRLTDLDWRVRDTTVTPVAEIEGQPEAIMVRRSASAAETTG